MSKDIILGWPLKKSPLVDTAKHPLRREQIEESEINAIKYSGDGHLVTFAPTGSGKGVSAIIPNLLHYKGPIIVIDPKGENFAVTARYRKELGQKVYLLDPFKYVPDEVIEKNKCTRDSLNPIDICLLKENYEMEAQMIADLITEGGAFDDPFWENHAKKIISGLIYLECSLARKENRKPKLSKAINYMFSDNPSLTLTNVIKDLDPPKFVRQSIYSGFISISAEGTKDGMLTTVQSFLDIFTAEDLLNSIDYSSFSFESIQNNTDYTLYIVIPPNKLDSHKALLKLWTGSLMQSIMERTRYPDCRTLFILDECANLGTMEILLKAVTLLRGYGLQVWMFFQDHAQMMDLYGGQSQTMINNCAVFQTFGISRKASASSIASMLGTFTFNELLNMDKGQQILSFAPGKTKMSKQLKYFKDHYFLGRFEMNHRINN